MKYEFYEEIGRFDNAMMEELMEYMARKDPSNRKSFFAFPSWDELHMCDPHPPMVRWRKKTNGTEIRH